MFQTQRAFFSSATMLQRRKSEVICFESQRRYHQSSVKSCRQEYLLSINNSCREGYLQSSKKYFFFVLSQLDGHFHTSPIVVLSVQGQCISCMILWQDLWSCDHKKEPSFLCLNDVMAERLKCGQTALENINYCR